MRRQYLIDRRLQVKYIILTIVLLLTYTILFSAIIFVPHILNLSSNASLDEQARAAQTLLNLHESVWPALGVVITILGVISVFVTHKIAGPAYNIKKTLANVAAGNLDSSVKLRKKDELKDLAEDINEIINELRMCVALIEEGQAVVSVSIDEINDKINNDKIEKADGSELVERLSGYLDDATLKLRKYTYTD